MPLYSVFLLCQKLLLTKKHRCQKHLRSSRSTVSTCHFVEESENLFVSFFCGELIQFYAFFWLSSPAEPEAEAEAEVELGIELGYI